MLKHKMKLLQDIADGLKERGEERIRDLYVSFDANNGVDSYEFGLAQALDNIVNNVYWDERGDWSEADAAQVYTL